MTYRDLWEQRGGHSGWPVGSERLLGTPIPAMNGLRFPESIGLEAMMFSPSRFPNSSEHVCRSHCKLEGRDPLCPQSLARQQ